MGNITLSLPDVVQKDMKKFAEIKWSEVARKAIIKKIETLKLVEEIAEKSKLTEKEVIEFSKKLKSLATKRFLNESNS